MKRREFIALLGSTVAWPIVGLAQQTKIYRIGVISAGSVSASARAQPAFVQALSELGWVEGKNILFEYRYADNRLERLPILATELVGLNVDIIVAIGTLAPIAAKEATSTIPIIMASAGDPFASGLVTNLSRPGGNVTGVSMMSAELGAKRLQMLKELLPNLSRVAVIWNAVNPYAARDFKETVGAAQTLGVEVHSIEVRTPADFDNAYEAIARHRQDALMIVNDPLTARYKELADFAIKNLLPSITSYREFADAGALITYGPDSADMRRRAASFVDRVLRGEKPGDLPVEQPNKFDLIINLRTAKALGLAVPPSLLARADEVIE